MDRLDHTKSETGKSEHVAGGSSGVMASASSSQAKAVINEPACPPAGKKRGARLLIGAVLVLAAGVGCAYYYVKSIAPFETTDDAFIESHVMPVSSQVPGRVAKVLVKDNQLVNAGEVLVEIDSSDFEVRLDQARASLASAKNRLEQAHAQLTVDQAKIEQEKANVTAVEAEAKRAETDSKRFQAVGITGVSQSQLDLAETQAHSTAAKVLESRSKLAAAQALVGLDNANIQTATSEIKKSEAAVLQAELDLSYTKIKAHESGFVTRKTIENGAYIQPGLSLMAVVPREIWVVANFKETQLTDMRPGQTVEVRVDAYPKIKFAGHVDSIQTGAGARFSLFPPENATGNYVKVIQRVPVKIVLDESSVLTSGIALGPGMSVEPKVRVREEFRLGHESQSAH